jgi:tRNA(Ile)-lysidine synthase
VRSQVLPLLESTLGPGIVEALARTAVLAQEDADALDEWADRVWAEVQAGGDGSPTDGTEGSAPRPRQAASAPPAPPEGASPHLAAGALPVAALRSGAGDLPLAVVHRVIRRFLVDAGCPASDLSFGHIRAVAGLLQQSGGRAVVDLLVVRA